tara:strand:+ start:3783 stop:5039 length:1257 start_codon:yes stop_codon:yes gene_type:complete
MRAFQAYERIQAFKASHTAIINAVNYGHVVASFLYDESLLGLVKKVMFSLFFTTRITVNESKGNGLLLYYSCRHKKRADYDYIPQRLHELLGDGCDYIESSEKFSLTQFLHTFKELPNAWRSTQGYRAKRLQRLGCSLLIAKYRSTAARVFPSFLRGKHRLITFCDAQAPENLLVQMANRIEIETFTTQHGQYRVLDASNISSDAEAYANFVSDYMLCWGEATRKEFVCAGFRPEKFITIGWIKRWGSAAPRTPRTRRNVLGVMLNGENGKESNGALLESTKAIASALNLRYLVRLHPWTKAAHYTKFLDDRCAAIGHYDLFAYLGEVDFSLAHMSGATIEILHANAPVYLLNDGKLAEAFRVAGLSFNDTDAITAAVSKDLESPDLARQRFQMLSKWFNDDSAQSARICATFFDQEV